MNNKKDEERYNKAFSITLLSIFVNTLLTVFKFVAGILSNSAGLIADAIHSLSDFASDFIILIATKLSQKPSDERHPFGHSKIETISSFILGLILFVVGSSIMYQSVMTIIGWFQGQEIKFETGIFFWIIIGVSIISKELLFQVTIRIGKKFENYSLIANAWHHRSDSLGSIAVLLGAIISILTGFKVADSFAAVAVSVLILKVALEILLQSGNILIDASADKNIMRNIRIISNSTKEVIDTHAIKTRKIGNGFIAYLDIIVDNRISVARGHNIAERVKSNIINKIDNVKDVIVHIDPYNFDIQCISNDDSSPINKEINKKIIDYIKEIERNLSQKVKITNCIIRSTEHKSRVIDIDLEVNKNMIIIEAHKIALILKKELKLRFNNLLREIRVEMIPSKKL